MTVMFSSAKVVRINLNSMSKFPPNYVTLMFSVKNGDAGAACSSISEGLNLISNRQNSFVWQILVS